jgi:hypothetical protein
VGSLEEDGSVGEGTGDGKGENELRRISFFFPWAERGEGEPREKET